MIKKFKQFLNENISFQEMNRKYGYDWRKDFSPEEYYEILFNSSEFNGSNFYWKEPYTFKGLEGKRGVWGNLFSSRSGGKELHVDYSIVHNLDQPQEKAKRNKDGYIDWKSHFDATGVILKKMIEDKYGVKIDYVSADDSPSGREYI